MQDGGGIQALLSMPAVLVLKGFPFGVCFFPFSLGLSFHK